MNNNARGHMTSLIIGSWAVKKREEINEKESITKGEAFAVCYLTGIIDAAAANDESARNEDANPMDALQRKLEGYLNIDGEES